MTISVIKMHFHKLPQRVISYRGFEKFKKRGSWIFYSQDYNYAKNPHLFFNIC